jgi:TolA-binding protein
MKNTILNINSSDECLNEEILLGYIRNKISEEKKHSVELHIANCELCNDLFEGLSQMKNYEKLPVIVHELNSRVDAILDKKPKIIVLDYYKIFMLTASILLLVTLTYFVTLYYINYENYVAQNSKIETLDNAIIINNSKNQRNNELIIIVSRPKYTEEQKQELAAAKQNEIDLFKNEIIADNIFFNENKDRTEEVTVINDLDDGVYDKTELEDSNFASGEALVKEDVTTNDLVEEILSSKVVVASDFESVNAIVENNKSSKKSSKDYGFDDFADENYEKAKTNFDTEITENPKNDTALFYKGLSDYQLQNFDEANNLFDIILLNPESSFYEDALYFKALTCINQGKNKIALKYLHQVVDYNGKYINLAKQKISELE